MPRPHVLLLSPGAKVGLAQAWAAAVKSRDGMLSAWEADPYAPACRWCHRTVREAPFNDAVSAGRLLDWCRQERPQLVVPTRHGDLGPLASLSDRLGDLPCTAAVSTPDCIALCTDKQSTHEWLARAGFPVPEQTKVVGWQQSPLRDRFPLIAKHPRGSGSSGVRLCQSTQDMAALPEDWLLQSVAPGVEYTVNVYVDRHGRCLCTIPHERILVHEGEVVRGRTTKNPALMKLARKIAESLPGARGPLNIQMFWDEASARATVVEINPRFGGGYPLSHRAGATFTDWLLQEYIEGSDVMPLDHWEDNLLMVRYREAQFHSAASRQTTA